MLQVTKSAVDKIKEELEDMGVEADKPFIRVYMALG